MKKMMMLFFCYHQCDEFNIKSRELENQFTSLTFPNIAYRVEF